MQPEDHEAGEVCIPECNHGNLYNVPEVHCFAPSYRLATTRYMSDPDDSGIAASTHERTL
jgi:hypothetical protein